MGHYADVCDQLKRAIDLYAKKPTPMLEGKINALRTKIRAMDNAIATILKEGGYEGGGAHVGNVAEDKITDHEQE